VGGGDDDEYEYERDECGEQGEFGVEGVWRGG